MKSSNLVSNGSESIIAEGCDGSGKILALANVIYSSTKFSPGSKGVKCPNPLVELDLNVLMKRIKEWPFMLFLLSRAHDPYH